jgi:hypothetical protein
LKDEDLMFFVSPLQRTFETILPTLKNIFDQKTIDEIVNSYYKNQNEYQEIVDRGQIISFLMDEKSKTQFQLHPQVFVDRRLTDIIANDFQDKLFKCDMIKRTDDKL